GWDTANVTSMYRMFYDTRVAQPDTSGWDTGNVANMSDMFRYARVANPDTSGWDTANVTTMANMFYDARVANPDTSGWDTANVTTMRAMFHGAWAANPDTSGWDTSNVTRMGHMFQNAKAANPDTSGWDTSNVTSVYRMFYGATDFDGDLSGFDLSGVDSIADMITGTALSPKHYGGLLVNLARNGAPPEQTVDATDLRYSCEGFDARATLIAVYGWSFTGDVEGCPPRTPDRRPDLLPQSDNGVSNRDNSTSAESLAIRLRCTETGGELRLYHQLGATDRLVDTTPCTEIGPITTVVASDGLEGDGAFTVAETDALGNESERSPRLYVQIDTTSPADGGAWLQTPTGVLTTPDAELRAGCPADAAGGRAIVTTEPAGGFSPYPALAVPKRKGSFKVTNLTWNDGDYDLVITCFDRADNGPGVTTFSPGVSVQVGGGTAADASADGATGGFSVADGGAAASAQSIQPVENPELRSQSLAGSCPTAAGGRVAVTTEPENGLTPYPATGTVGDDGTFLLTDLTWYEGDYQLVITCTDANGESVGFQPDSLDEDLSPEIRIDDGDNVTAMVEDAGPNDGDANGDGVRDSRQVNVTSYQNQQLGNYVVTEAEGECSHIDAVDTHTEVELQVQDADFNYRLGLHAVDLRCGEIGGSATITHYWDTEYDTTLWTYRKYTGDGFVNFDEHVTYGTADIDGRRVTTVTFTITDGGPYDADGRANGIIRDPAGPAIRSTVMRAPDSPSMLGFGLVLTTICLGIGTLAGMLVLGSRMVSTIRRRPDDDCVELGSL
ncbi:MAG: BspA family leucine-rich repeat surface protein, partial [Actinomycetota bacterium]